MRAVYYTNLDPENQRRALALQALDMSNTVVLILRNAEGKYEATQVVFA